MKTIAILINGINLQKISIKDSKTIEVLTLDGDKVQITDQVLELLFDKWNTNAKAVNKIIEDKKHKEDIL